MLLLYCINVTMGLPCLNRYLIFEIVANNLKKTGKVIPKNIFVSMDICIAQWLSARKVESAYRGRSVYFRTSICSSPAMC